jgi:hypothetical protein
MSEKENIVYKAFAYLSILLYVDLNHGKTRFTPR